MSIIFDEKGNVVGQTAEPDREPSNGKIIICPTCGTVTIATGDVVAEKTKSRTCPRCGTYLGEW